MQLKGLCALGLLLFIQLFNDCETTEVEEEEDKHLPIQEVLALATKSRTWLEMILVRLSPIPPRT